MRYFRCPVLPASLLFPALFFLVQDVPVLVRSIGDLHRLEMGRLFGVSGAVPLESVRGAGMVHRHLRAGDISPQ